MFNAQEIDTYRRDVFNLLRAQRTKNIELVRDLNVLNFRTDCQLTIASSMRTGSIRFGSPENASHLDDGERTERSKLPENCCMKGQTGGF